MNTIELEKMTAKPDSGEPKPARRLDFGVDMHLPENHNKLVDFVRDLHMETGGDDTWLDALIMLAEAFNRSANDEHPNVQDLAWEVQSEAFKLTREFEVAQKAYVDYISKGVRDYRRESDDQSAWEYSKGLMHMAGYIAQEPNRMKAMREEIEAERAARPIEPPATMPDLDPAEKISILRRMSADFAKSAEEIEGDSAATDELKMAAQLAEFLNNPRCPTKLYNKIVDELTDHDLARHTATEQIAGVIRNLNAEERKAAEEQEKQWEVEDEKTA